MSGILFFIFASCEPLIVDSLFNVLLKAVILSSFRLKSTTLLQLKSVVEEVLNLHFDEIELVVVLKSLNVGKYFDKGLGNMPPPQQASRMNEFGVKFQKCSKHAFMYIKLFVMF